MGTSKPAAEALDWANDLAAQIIGDAFALRYTEAQRLIAERLRLVAGRAKLEEVKDTAEVVLRAMRAPSEATLQAEHQRDHDDERAHGWADGPNEDAA